MGPADYTFVGMLAVCTLYSGLSVIYILSYNFSDITGRSVIEAILPVIGLAVLVTFVVAVIIYLQHIMGNLKLTVLPTWL